MVQRNESELCSPVRQLEASANTLVPLMVAAVVLAFCFSGPFPIDRYLHAEGMSEVWADRAAGFLVLGIPAFWVAIDGGGRRATIGMRRRRMEFRCHNGRPLTFSRCFLRIVLGMVLLPAFPILLMLAFIDPQRRTLSDKLCGTVIRFCDAG